LKIKFSKHASIRLVERACQLGISTEDALRRVKETIKEKKLSRKKKSRNNLVYYKYFYDNASFFVVCSKKQQKLMIRTIIIKEVRE